MHHINDKLLPWFQNLSEPLLHQSWHLFWPVQSWPCQEQANNPEKRSQTHARHIYTSTTKKLKICREKARVIWTLKKLLAVQVSCCWSLLAQRSCAAGSPIPLFTNIFTLSCNIVCPPGKWQLKNTQMGCSNNPRTSDSTFCSVLQASKKWFHGFIVVVVLVVLVIWN